MRCHLENGTGTENWQSRNSDGTLPPPPLNGTAHTWHHDFGVLARTIIDGGARLGGSMPGFGETLSAREIAEVIAYVQSLWPEEIYQRWSKAYPEDAANGIPYAQTESPKTPPENPVLDRLRALFPAGTKFGAPEPTSIEGIIAVRAGSRYFYLDDTGRYLFTGDLVDLATRENLTQQRFATVRRDLMATFPESDKVVFPATGAQKGVVDVFTDTTCPYCRRLHQEVPTLQASGVTVRYLPFPRSGNQGEGYDQLRSVWCADDPPAEMTRAKTSSEYRPGTTDCPAARAVSVGYRLGIDVGVNGTPAIVLQDGTLLPGYMPAEELLAEMGVRRDP